MARNRVHQTAICPASAACARYGLRRRNIGSCSQADQARPQAHGARATTHATCQAHREAARAHRRPFGLAGARLIVLCVPTNASMHSPTSCQPRMRASAFTGLPSGRRTPDKPAARRPPISPLLTHSAKGEGWNCSAQTSSSSHLTEARPR